MKTTIFLLLAVLPAWAASQSFQTLPENSDSLEKLNAVHSCSFHQILPKQRFKQLRPEQLGPVVGVSVEMMDGKVFKLGKYFRPQQEVVFYADDEAFNVQDSALKSGLARAQHGSDVLQLQYERDLSTAREIEEDMMFGIFNVTLQQHGKITHQQKLIRMCQM